MENTKNPRKESRIRNFLDWASFIVQVVITLIVSSPLIIRHFLVKRRNLILSSARSAPIKLIAKILIYTVSIAMMFSILKLGTWWIIGSIVLPLIFFELWDELFMETILGLVCEPKKTITQIEKEG